MKRQIRNFLRVIYMHFIHKTISKYPFIHTHVLYFILFKKPLNLKNPQGFNQKILWLKLNEYQKPIYTQCADKYAVRAFVENRGCAEILNDLYGIYNTVDAIDFDSLPDQFALKCNHGAGYNLICNDKNHFDIPSTKKQLNKWLNEDFSALFSEPQYKKIQRKIIVEKFIENNMGEFPDDYKFYCFHGEPIFVMLCQGRKSNNTKFYYFDMNWKMQPLSQDSIDALENGLIIDKPEGFDSLIKYAQILSENFKFVRADFYLVDGQPFFGELTFTPSGGLDQDRLEATDIILGNHLKLERD